jgi:hypothetical protein
MKVEFSSIALSKLKAASAEDRRAVEGVIERLNAASKSIGRRLTGVENGFQVSASAGGPLLLYVVSPEGVATVKGLITSLQRKFGNVAMEPRAGAVRSGSKTGKRRAAQEANGN